MRRTVIAPEAMSVVCARLSLMQRASADSSFALGCLNFVTCLSRARHELSALNALLVEKSKCIVGRILKYMSWVLL